MKIKLKISVSGTFHNIDGGVVVGQVVEVPDAEGERYIALGYAEAVKGGKLSEEHAVANFSKEERAVLDTDVVGASHGAVPNSKSAQARQDDPEPLVYGEDEPEVEPAQAAEVKHQELVDTYVNDKGESVSRMKTVKAESDPAPSPSPKPRPRKAVK